MGPMNIDIGGKGEKIAETWLVQSIFYTMIVEPRLAGYSKVGLYLIFCHPEIKQASSKVIIGYIAVTLFIPGCAPGQLYLPAISTVQRAWNIMTFRIFY